MNVGHGDCAILETTLTQRVGFIDLGSLNPSRFPLAIQVLSDAAKGREIDLVLSHYHWDHYSFLGSIGNPPLNRLIVPAIPLSAATESISKFFALADIAGYGYYRLLPKALMSASEVIAAHRAEPLNLLDLRCEVLWPDYSQSIPVIHSRVTKLHEKLMPIFAEAEKSLSIDDRQYFDKLVREISISLSEGRHYRDTTKKVSSRRSVDKLIPFLDKIEHHIKEIADYFSLAFKLDVENDESFGLFLGDCPSQVLGILAPPGGPFVLVKGAHHGTRYGNCLDPVQTIAEVFSRGPRTKRIHDGYLHCVEFQLFHSTDLHGDLVVSCNDPPATQVTLP